MPTVETKGTLEGLRQLAQPLSRARGDYDSLLEIIGNAKYVLLGEATHGTHEFYQARAEISKRLIQEQGATVIAWEADWPDTLRINRFIQGPSEDRTPLEAFGDFKRFPSWMWRNADVVDFVPQLYSSGGRLPRQPRSRSLSGGTPPLRLL